MKRGTKGRRGFFLRAALVILTGAIGFTSAQADIYKYVDSSGRVHISDRALTPKYTLILKTRKAWTEPKFSPKRQNRKKFASLIKRVADKFKLDDALITAVVAVESGFDPDAVSRAGAVGLMQLMPGTAKRYRASNRRDPLQNLHAGTWYLRDLLLRFNNLALALAAYNAGEQAVIRHGNNIPPYSETQRYVRKVILTYRRLRKSAGGA